MTIQITQATEADIPALYALYDQIGKKDEGYFEACFDKDCIILTASIPTAVMPRLDRSISSLEQLDPSIINRRQGYGRQEPKDDNLDEERVTVAFGILNFEPKYALYQRLDIPEIQDLNVIPDARQQGIATTLITAFENMARDQGADKIGISVGLTKDYGPAQRLYAKLGYIPDGYGVTYNRAPIKAGASYLVDDDLALMMVKEL